MDWGKYLWNFLVKDLYSENLKIILQFMNENMNTQLKDLNKYSKKENKHVEGAQRSTPSQKQVKIMKYHYSLFRKTKF